MNHPTTHLIPQATRVYEPTPFEDTSDETIWTNPTEKDAVLDLHVETPVARGQRMPPRNWEELTGKRRYVIKAKTTRSLPSEFDRAIQHVKCDAIECLSKPFDCKNQDHPKTIIGGLGTQLVNKGTQRRHAQGLPPPSYTLHPSLDDVEAAKKELLTKRFEEFKAGEEANAKLEAGRAQLAALDAEIAKRKAQLEAANELTVPPEAAGKTAKTAKGKPETSSPTE